MGCSLRAFSREPGSAARGGRAGRTAASLVAATALVSGLLSVPLAASAAPDDVTVPASSTIDPSSFSSGTYIVTLKESPAASYTGGVSGYKATKPAKGKQLDATTQKVTDYVGYLRDKQNALAKKVGAKVIYNYALAGNGFAAKLTASQAARLAKSSSVRSVVKNELLKPTAAERSIDYLGVTEEQTGTWAQLGGRENAGAGVVVGDIDTGVAPENPSFAGEPLGTDVSGEPYLQKVRDEADVVFEKSDGTQFRSPLIGDAEQWSDANLSTKLVGAQYFVEGFGETNIGTPEADDEYLSPRDGDGHGSHTGSTAVGEYGVSTEIDGRDFGDISGVAPEAKLSVYKACWTGNEPDTTDDDGCATLDLIAAIDAATKDGVDVINFSIGGGAAASTYDVIDDYFLGAAAAGIFVSASAGNSGPSAVTADHGAPWYTTVAASTIPDYEGTVELGNGSKYVGASITVTEPVGPAPFVEAADVAKSTATPADAARCVTGTLDPTLAAGAIVLCDRGGNDRVAKSATVEAAGGVGMVLVNPPASANDVDNDFHSVPTVHIATAAYDAVHAYANTEGATATLLPGHDPDVAATPVPQLADFSSRGPVLADGSDILKPDIAAPGVSILAAAANAEGAEPTFEFLSGTSMAAPHITGLAALYLSKNPEATPAEIKSAMMTSASDLLDAEGDAYQDPFGQGAGQVEPRDFLEPGLIYDADVPDYIGYLVGLGYYTEADFGIPGIDASDLNQPSISIGDLLGSQTVTRTVRAEEAGTYTASVDLPGYDVKVEPETFSVAAGESKDFTVTFTRNDAPLDEWATGFLTWTSSDEDAAAVRSPLAIHATSVVAPETVTGKGSTGSTTASFTSGFDGTEKLSFQGFTQGDSNRATADASLDSAFALYNHSVPEGTGFARFDVAPDVENPATDLDLFVYLAGDVNDPTTWVLAGQSASGSASESVSLTDPEPGTYVAEVDYYTTPTGGVPYTESAFALSAQPGLGDPTLEPSSIEVKAGDTPTYTIKWKGLAGNAQYLGRVLYGDSGVSTYVVVDTVGAPVGTKAPSVSGSTEVGSTLTVDPGTWNIPADQLSFGYQWTANGAPIAGATNSTFTVPSSLLGASIAVTVTAKNSLDGSTTTATATAGTVVAAGSSTLVNTAPPTISGTFKPSHTVNATTGTWNVPAGDLSFTYQWTSNGKPIAGATDKTLTIPASSVGDKVAVVVTAHLGTVAVAATSASIVPKWNSRTTISIKDSTITTKQKAKITVKVNAAGSGKETGTVVLHYGSKKKTDVLHTSDRGKVTFTLPKLKKGSYKIWAEFKGNRTVGPDDSITKSLKVRKAS
jgi:subtilisin family serine protease